MVDRWAECGGVGGLLSFERVFYVAGLVSTIQCMVVATGCPLPGLYAMLCFVVEVACDGTIGSHAPILDSVFF
jgi:hypothetical protein